MRRSFSFYYFKPKPIRLESKYQRWRDLAGTLEFSAAQRLRVEWMVFYHLQAKCSATLTCKHFNISRKTFHKWLKRFKASREDIQSLRDSSRAPINKRTWQVSLTQEQRIKALRLKYMHYGKKKLKVIYQRLYNEQISTWKIERVIRKHTLYPDKKRHASIARKRALSRLTPKQRINSLEKLPRPYFLFQLDTITLYYDDTKRYILTAIDHASKLAYARMYKNKSSKSATDFLYRLKYLVGHPIENLQTDNGSEFAHLFEDASRELKIKRFFSRIKTPKDNPECERFNQTLQYEWLYDSNMDTDCDRFNKSLTEWLEEYNFNRPHETLAYLTPMEYIDKHAAGAGEKVLPMYPARTMC